MSMRCTLRIRPDDRYTAEVVAVITSLGAKRPEYNAGKRVRDLLEIKRVHHKIIDFNRDCRGALGITGTQMDRVIERLTQEPMAARRLQTETSEGDEDLVLPQIFIDGLYVGNAEEMQSLEDDGLLEKILLRQICPARKDGIETRDDFCGAKRSPSDKQCRKCQSSFDELMSNLQTLDEAILQIDREEAQEFTSDDEYDTAEDEEQ
eukprot:GEMP01053439.1.p1 GENE.GEMP01053439.1~~GEMP01053439.1.p1  ORF type:complete len:206 (+),score=44.14 GEMP01053439.1:117-734(+)